MNSIHDMGGMDGFGAVRPEPERAAVSQRMGKPRVRDQPRDGLCLRVGDERIARVDRGQDPIYYLLLFVLRKVGSPAWKHRLQSLGLAGADELAAVF